MTKKRQKRRTKQQIQSEELARYHRGEITREQLFKALIWVDYDKWMQMKKVQEDRKDLPRGVTCSPCGKYYLARIGERRLNEKTGKYESIQTYFGTDLEGAIRARSRFVEEQEVKKHGRRRAKAGLKQEAKELKKQAMASRTFKELVEWYLSLEEVISLKAYSKIVGTMRIATAFFGDYSLEEIDNDLVREFRRWRSQGGHEYTNGLSAFGGSEETRTLVPADNVTINLDMQRLRTMFQKAHDNEKIFDFNLNIFTKIKESKPMRRLIKQWEYDLMLEKIDNQDHLDLIIAAWETAMRADELAQMQVSWIHLDEVVSEVPHQVASYIDIPAHITKTDASRQVPISGALRKILERRCQNLQLDDFVFTDYYSQTDTTQGWGSSNRIGKMFHYWCKKLGIVYGDRLKDASGKWARDTDDSRHRKGCTFHCFRGTRITL